MTEENYLKRANLLMGGSIDPLRASGSWLFGFASKPICLLSRIRAAKAAFNSPPTYQNKRKSTRPAVRLIHFSTPMAYHTTDSATQKPLTFPGDEGLCQMTFSSVIPVPVMPPVRHSGAPLRHPPRSPDRHSREGGNPVPLNCTFSGCCAIQDYRHSFFHAPNVLRAIRP